MKIDQLQWDDENIEHTSRHHVNPGEVEDVCFGIHIATGDKGGRYILSGQTAGGRYVNVVIERVGKGVFRPVTAFEMSDSYKRQCRKRLRSK